jgi:DNA-binding Xre family transcriptional regulator
MKEMHRNKFQLIQQQDELEVELARITATKKLKIAHDTAMKEKQIRSQIMKDNLSLLSEGKANEIDLEKLTGQELNAMAKETGRMALAEMAKHNKQAFQLNKALAIADATVSTAQGVSKALSLGPLGIPLAVAIGALGIAQVATIARTKYQGRRLGGRRSALYGRRSRSRVSCSR